MRQAANGPSSLRSDSNPTWPSIGGDLLQDGLDGLKLGATVEEIYGHDWIRDPFSKGTWLALRPGQAPDLARVETQWGVCHLAGADFAGVWSGWVDGAIESGRTTAAEVDAALQSDLSV